MCLLLESNNDRVLSIVELYIVKKDKKFFLI